MTRMVCLGDSFTEGMSDETRPDGRYLGWADRVAARIAEHRPAGFAGDVRYANLAVRGKLLNQVIEEQVGPALAMDPDLITFHAGPNDVLRPVADVPDLLRRYARTVDRLAQTGARIVLFTAIPRAGGNGIVADRVAARLTTFNDGVRRTARRHACTLVDNARVTALADRQLWAEDRLHLNADGHRRVAAHVLACLGVTDPEVLSGPVGWWEQPLPPPQRTRSGDLASDAAWVGQHFLPWVGRRVRRVSSGDGVSAKDPELRPIESGMPMPHPDQRR
jgi:lysophospholipase L1-like esterase